MAKGKTSAHGKRMAQKCTRCGTEIDPTDLFQKNFTHHASLTICIQALRMEINQERKNFIDYAEHISTSLEKFNERISALEEKNKKMRRSKSASTSVDANVKESRTGDG